MPEKVLCPLPSNILLLLVRLNIKEINSSLTRVSGKIPIHLSMVLVPKLFWLVVILKLLEQKPEVMDLPCF